MKPEGHFVALWVAVGIVVAALAGGAAGLLGWAGGQPPATALLTGGGGFAGTLAIYVMILKLFLTRAT